MIRFNTLTAPKSDSVIVIGAGPSTGSNMDSILKYANENKSIIFAANYNYGIKVHFTYFTDPYKLKKEFKNIKGNIVLRKLIYSSFYDAATVKNGFKLYVAGRRKGVNNIYKNTSINFDKNGNPVYPSLGTAGLGCIILGMICAPKKMLIVGLDGPEKDITYKMNHLGHRIHYNKPKKHNKVKTYMSNCILPTLKKKGIQVDIFDNVGLYGVSLSGINIL